MRRHLLRAISAAAALYASWLGMEAAHEAGHVLHAWASGGRVARVELPLLGFSRTDVVVNPRPGFVAWGGPVWGVLIPLAVLAVWRAVVPRWIRGAGLVQFWAGFCLIANGAYLGVGWVDRAGDAGDLLKSGTPVWVLVTYGAAAVAGGLFLWHRLGLKSDRHEKKGGRRGTAPA